MTPFHHGFIRFINKYSFRKALIGYETEDMMKYDCASPDIGRKKLIFQVRYYYKALCDLCQAIENPRRLCSKDDGRMAVCPPDRIEKLPVFV